MECNGQDFHPGAQKIKFEWKKISISFGITGIRHSFIFYFLCHKPQTSKRNYRSFECNGIVKDQWNKEPRPTRHARQVITISYESAFKLLVVLIKSLVLPVASLHATVYVMDDYKCCRFFQSHLNVSRAWKIVSLRQLHHHIHIHTITTTTAPSF